MHSVIVQLVNASSMTMKPRNFLVALLSFCWSISSANLFAEDDWRQLFNGRDLAGWQTNVHTDSFQVSDGLLSAHCTVPNQRSHLFYVGESDGLVKFKNFELVVVFRGQPSSNSGVFFHTDMSTRDSKLHLAKGYEVT